jgi:methanogenic corrinoid protein MtbC1
VDLRLSTLIAPMPKPTRSAAALPGDLAIAEVALETGVQKDTLRVWERRYGFPVPLRDALGERRYSAEQVHRLRLIKRLLDAGLRPGGVVALSAEALEAQLRQLPADAARPRGRRPAAQAPAPSGAVPVTDPTTGADWPQWRAWLHAGAVDAMHQALGQHALKHGLIHTVDGLLGPLGQAVGQAWFAGDITVYQEHLYTEAVTRFLQDALTHADRQHPAPRQAPRVLLTTLPGEQHTLGLLMAECMLALEGCERLSLGRDTPLTDLLQAAHQWQVDVVALSVSAHAPASEVWAGLRQLVTGLPAGVQVWVGGSSPHLHRRGMPQGPWVLGRVGELSAAVLRWRQR